MSDENDTHPLERLDNNYLVESDKDGVVEYEPEGGDEVELVYKLLMAKEGQEGVENDSLTLEIITLTRLYNDIMEASDERDKIREAIIEDSGSLDKEAQDALETGFRVKTSDDVFLFYTLANELTKSFAAEILSSRLFDERETVMEGTLKNMDQKELADMLYHSGVVEKKIKDGMLNINSTRNKLVHQFKNRHYLESIQDIVPMVKRVSVVLDELCEMVEGHRPFET